MISVIGEVLFDMFPDYSRLGGAPLNFAAHCRRFGNGVRFCSRVGSDTEGALVRDALRGLGLDDALVQTAPDFPTGRVFVKLDAQGVPEFYIARDMAYDMLRLDDAVSGLLRGNCRLLYNRHIVQSQRRSPLCRCRSCSRTCHAGCEIFYDIISCAPAATPARNSLNRHCIRATILKLNDGELDDIRHLCALPAGREEERSPQFANVTISTRLPDAGRTGRGALHSSRSLSGGSASRRTLKGHGGCRLTVLPLCWTVGLLSHWHRGGYTAPGAPLCGADLRNRGQLPS